jgi:hypothetical protein
MAVRHHMHFGTQVVFTYGPLGFLKVPGLWYDGLAWVAFVYSAVLFVALAIALTAAARRLAHPVIAAVLAFVVLAAAPGIEVAVAVAAVVCLIALSPDPPPWIWPVITIGGALLGAIETLALPRSGLVILAISALTLLTVGTRRWLRLAAFAAIAAAALVVLWVASGQSASNAGAYARGSFQIISGYSEAMGSQPGHSFYLPSIVLVAVALPVVGVLLVGEGRRRAVAALLTLLVAFVLFKEAAVRQDLGHRQILLGTGAALFLAFAAGGRRRLGWLGVLAALALALAMPRSPLQSLDLNPVSHARSLGDEVSALASPGRTEFVTRIGLLLQYRLPTSTLKLLRGHTVAIDPWENTVAWLYGLHWDPLPVLQDYSAYTTQLDELDAAALRSPGAPERILRENTLLVDPTHLPAGLDNRLPAWDPPARALALLCHYRPLQTGARWEVLGRTTNRCGAPHLIARLAAANGKPVTLPKPARGHVLFVRIRGAGVGGLERVRSFLYRAVLRYIVVNDRASYRLVPGTATDGLLVAAAPGTDFPAPFALSPAARTLAVLGVSDALGFDVYSMAVG